MIRTALCAALIALIASGGAARDKPLPPAPIPPAPLDDAALLAGADPVRGAQEWRRCRACHGVEPGRHGIGPSLHAIVGAPVGGQPGFRYSDALTSLGGLWTVTALSAFLENPRATAPGTLMAFAGLTDPAARLNLIAWLATQRD